VLDHVLEGIITTDASGMIESMNSAAEAMFDLISARAIGSSFSSLLADPYRQQYEQYFADYAQGNAGKMLGIDAKIRGQRTINGSFPLTCTLSEMKIGDERKLIVVAHDALSVQDQNKRSA